MMPKTVAMTTMTGMTTQPVAESGRLRDASGGGCFDELGSFPIRTATLAQKGLQVGETDLLNLQASPAKVEAHCQVPQQPAMIFRLRLSLLLHLHLVAQRPHAPASHGVRIGGLSHWPG